MDASTQYMSTQAYPDDQYLLTKQELAERLGLKIRGVESLVERRKIPALRISGRCVRFSWPRVLAALAKFEIKEIG
jgi:excisionase family DNA binding protein